MWPADIYFLGGHLQAASVICARGLAETTCFYQQCPQQANQVAFRQSLEFSKRLMLLSWLKWVRFIFTLSCISQELPFQSLQIMCATAGDSLLYNEGQRVTLWPQTETEEESNWEAPLALVSSRYLSAEEKLGSLESYGVITGLNLRLTLSKKQDITAQKIPGYKMQCTSLGLSQGCECW